MTVSALSRDEAAGWGLSAMGSAQVFTITHAPLPVAIGRSLREVSHHLARGRATGASRRRMSGGARHDRSLETFILLHLRVVYC
jgi:hypothetical protein